MSKGSVLALVVLATMVSACAPESKAIKIAVDLHVEPYRLANGLEVVIHEDPSFRDVAVNIRYRVGSKDDPEGQGGMAHFAEHLMFRGSQHSGGKTFQEALDEVTVANPNAFTSHDETEYSTLLPAMQLPRALWLEADRLAFPATGLTEAGFATERDVVKNEWRERYDNRAFGNVVAQTYSALFPEGHPYHRTSIGTPEELDHITLDDVRAFVAKHYTPQNATLVIVGPLPEAQVRPLVAKYFGAVGNRSPLPIARSIPFSLLAETKEIRMKANVPNPLVAVSWRVPPPTHPSWYPLQFGLRPLLSRLHYDFVVQSKVASSVHASCDGQRLAGICTLQVSLRPGESPDAVLSVINHRIADADKYLKLEWNRLAEIRTQFLSHAIFEVEDVHERANAIQTGLDYFNNANQTQADLKRIDAVTPDEALDAVEQYLGAQGKVVITVTPDTNAPIGGRIQ